MMNIISCEEQDNLNYAIYLAASERFAIVCGTDMHMTPA